MPPGKAKCEECGKEFSGDFPEPGSNKQINAYLAFDIKEHHRITREESGKANGHLWFDLTLEDGRKGLIGAHSWGVELEYRRNERI
jgi:hypothetical protein